MLNKTQKRILSLFIRHPSYAWRLVNSFYQLSGNLLSKYEKVLDWSFISGNLSLVNSIEFIEKYADKLDWVILSECINAPINEDFIDRFKDKIIWSTNELDDSSPFQSFCANENIIWTLDRIKKYEKRIDWDDFSQNRGYFWSEQIIEKYSDMIRWDCFLPRFTKPYSEKFIEKFTKRISHPYNKLGIPDDISLIEKYYEDVSWYSVSGSEKIPWAFELINKWKDNLSFGLLIGNKTVVNSIEKFEEWFEDWNDDKYSWLSHNSGINWSINFLEQHKDKWDWEMISINESLPWSEQLIEYFEDYLIFGKLIPLVTEPGCFDVFSGMEINPGIPWSIHLLEKYEESWEFGLLEYNPSIWEKAFKPYVNDELVEYFIRISC